ncbi:MAG: hypothetical protein K2Y37_22420 [Pirellulales bacterium]|nr:hypothetical protein [Pirellulales bacterium]
MTDDRGSNQRPAVSATRLRNELLNVIAANQASYKAESGEKDDLLNWESGRTHAFLSQRRAAVRKRRFSKYGETWDGERYPSCLLMQLYAKCYPQSAATVEAKVGGLAGDKLDKELRGSWPDVLWFEGFKIDCVFLREPKQGMCEFAPTLPRRWVVDWVIEVENKFYEFCMTMRGMLDIASRARLGIFFKDNVKDGPRGGFSDEHFKHCVWDPYQEYSLFKDDPKLYVLFLPTKFTTIEQYHAGADLYEWNGNEFVNLR